MKGNINEFRPPEGMDQDQAEWINDVRLMATKWVDGIKNRNDRAVLVYARAGDPGSNTAAMISLVSASRQDILAMISSAAEDIAEVAGPHEAIQTIMAAAMRGISFAYSKRGDAGSAAPEWPEELEVDDAG